jgi:hypothetical protein
MKVFPVLAALALVPTLATAQEITITRSQDAARPFTLIHPATMEASGGEDGPLVINHPQAPLQCELAVVPVEDTTWTAQGALDALDDETIAQAWAETLPGFGVSARGTTPYQDGNALIYEGTSIGSDIGASLTLVHVEAVSNRLGYALDCLYAADQAQNARPIVDFIIANFSTRLDAEPIPAEAAAP